MFRVMGLGLLLLAGGCDDDAGGGGEVDAQSVRRPPDFGVVLPDGATPDGAVLGDAGTLDAAPVADAAPPSCTDESCGVGRICHEGRCLDGTRCGEGGTCPPGRICVDVLCFADPLAGGLAAEPEQLGFTFENPGDQAVRTVTLRNIGEAVLSVTRFEFEGDPTFEVLEAPELPFRLVPAQTRDVIIGYRADDARPDTGLVRVHADNGSSIEVRLASSAKVTGMAAPCLNLRPARLDFGAVARGQSAVRTFHLESCGEVPVTVMGVRRGVNFFGPLPDTFQLDAPPPFPVVLAPGDRHPIDVSYSPRRAGIEAGHWDVISDDAQNPQQRVDVSAIATPPPLEDIGLHVRLEWDTDLTDVDLHVLGPGGQLWTCAGDCYFSNPNPDFGVPGRFEDDPFLDLDDVDGFGPENVNIEIPEPGTYTVIVQYWDDHDGDVPDATLEVLSFGAPVARYGPQRLGSVNDEWSVVEIDWPGLAMRPLGQVVNRARGQLCGGF